ncbi:17695_t:CDS:2 [Funneliformis geosporum]|uniref:4052_t:CDS:1 n=1 Tax=Funneliformis geosporum TaxID=1117311 RepID=A0A9W4WW16_9GLOM|nr:17695_t:CDS:2 [Funneliformis geosporum]CAI2176372.1 4052_t:CDS:2 [Funneliformis geosporum]
MKSNSGITHVVTRISSRKLRSDNSITDRITDSNDDDNSSSTQQKLAQRLSRAIIKCDDNVPHNYLSSTFVRIVNISVLPESNIAKIWWKPDPQKGINESKIENTMNKYSIKYRKILQNALHMRNPPKIVFLRYDKTFGNMSKLLDKIEEELNHKETEP